MCFCECAQAGAMLRKKTGRTGYGVAHLWSQHLRDRARRPEHVKFEASLVYLEY